MKIALAQTEIVWENKNKNIERASELICKAKSSSADMIFFPEMSFTGFSMNTDITADINRETINTIKNICSIHELAVGFGWVEKNSCKALNHYTVISEQGKVISDYVKIHPFSYGDESIYFQSGKEIYTFNYKGLIFSTLICYDLRFPELFQVASIDSDIVVIAANWPQKRISHWNTLLRARAIENQTYVLGVNCVGQLDKQYYNGYTSAYDYNGNGLGSIKDKEDLLYIYIENNTTAIRESFPVKKDRKWSLYKEMYERVVNEM